MLEAGDMTAGDGWISDDSSYYGDEDEQLRRKSEDEHFKLKHEVRLNLNALVAKARARSRPPPDLHNPYEGMPDAWQLNESVSDFLSRLPPVTTSIDLVGPWIWVCNPRRERQSGSGYVGDFTKRGNDLLHEATEKKSKIEAENARKPKGVVTRMINQERELLKQRINHLATETNVTSGKWMLFPSLSELPSIWRQIVEGVLENRLGTAAKVATDDGSGATERLICVYTKDFRDTDDVQRVLQELMDMGLVKEDTPRGAIYYKSDAYTYLNVYGNNPYGLRASLYSSRELFTNGKFKAPEAGPQKKQLTLDGFRRR